MYMCINHSAPKYLPVVNWLDAKHGLLPILFAENTTVYEVSISRVIWQERLLSSFIVILYNLRQTKAFLINPSL